MITRDDLLSAIAECKGERNPNANTCIKLAAYYTIFDHMYGAEEDKGYSFSPPPQAPAVVQQDVVGQFGDSDFLTRISGMYQEDAWEIMDELMDALMVVNPRLYDGVMRKLA